MPLPANFFWTASATSTTGPHVRDCAELRRREDEHERCVGLDRVCDRVLEQREVGRVGSRQRGDVRRAVEESVGVLDGIALSPTAGACGFGATWIVAIPWIFAPSGSATIVYCPASAGRSARRRSSTPRRPPTRTRPGCRSSRGAPRSSHGRAGLVEGRADPDARLRRLDRPRLRVDHEEGAAHRAGGVVGRALDQRNVGSGRSSSAPRVPCTAVSVPFVCHRRHTPRR